MYMFGESGRRYALCEGGHIEGLWKGEVQKVEELGEWGVIETRVVKNFQEVWIFFLWEDFLVFTRYIAFGERHMEWCKREGIIPSDSDSQICLAIQFCPPVCNRLSSFSKSTLNCFAKNLLYNLHFKLS